MKEKNFLIILILFFITIFSLSPISGDDWGNYMVGSLGISHMIGRAVGMYFVWEGRLVSRLLINFLTYYKWIWNIVNSLSVCSIIYFSVKIIQPKDQKSIYLLSLLGILGMNIYMFSQGITWLAGNITYLFPISLLIFYLYFLKEHRIKEHPILFGTISFIIPMFVEHMAILLVIVHILTLIYNYIKSKKISRIIIIYLILSVISTLVMLLSPGSAARSAVENIEFNQLSLIGKVIYNIPNWIYYTCMIHGYGNILWIIATLYLIHKTILNKKIKIVLDIFVLIIPSLTLFSYHLNMIHISFLPTLVNPNHWFIICYWFCFIILYGALLIKNKKETDYINIFILAILGLFANIIMLVSPTWGYRTTLATSILLSIANLWIISKIKISEFIQKCIIIITILIMGIYLIFYVDLYRQNKKRETMIQEDLQSNSDVIRVKNLPFYAPCNSNPGCEYHDKVFKEYYKINPNKKLKIVP